MCVRSSVCVAYSRAVGPVTSQAALLVYRPPPIFGWGRALEHVWNSWIETDRATEIVRQAERGREDQTFTKIGQKCNTREFFFFLIKSKGNKKERIRNELKSRRGERRTALTGEYPCKA